MSNNTVVLGLEGDLQAYGTSSKYYIRDTDQYPSKSAVIGMILSAMGVYAPDQDTLTSLASMGMKVEGYRSKKSSEVLTDFHMLGSDHERNAWDKQFQLQAEKKTMSPSKMSWRRFLVGYKFKVVLEFGDANLHSQVVQALQNPQGTPCLGRRTCMPTAPIYRGTEDAPLFKDSGYEHVFTVHEGQLPDIGIVSFVNDVPVAMGYHKQYRSRAVTVERTL